MRRFAVMFSYDPQDGGVSVEPVMLDAQVTSATVSLMATAIAQDGTLTVAVLDVVGATIKPAVLPVRVLHELVLSFTAPGGASLETARVLAGGTTKVAVRLANPGSLGEGEKVQVSFATATTKVSVIPPEWTLTEERPSTIFTIEARHDVDPSKGTVVASGEVMLNGARVLDTRVVSTALAVEIVERRFRLSILDEAGISSSPLRVLEGSEMQLRLRLLSVSSSLGTPSLGEGEMLTVLLTFIDPTGTGSGILLVPAQVTFFRGSTETEVVLLLRGRSSDATLTAKAVEFGLRNVSVESTAVAVDVISRRFQLSLSPAGARFSRTVRPNEAIPDFTATQSVRSTITMAEATTIRSLSVRVEIRHSHIGDLRVLLISPEGTIVVLHQLYGRPCGESLRDIHLAGSYRSGCFGRGARAGRVDTDGR